MNEENVMVESEEAFDSWMACVDTALEERIGLSSDDLADYCYRDWFDGGMSPDDAAREAMNAEDPDLFEDDDDASYAPICASDRYGINADAFDDATYRSGLYHE